MENTRIISTGNDEIARLNLKIDSLNTLLSSSESQNEHVIARLQDECEMLKTELEKSAKINKERKDEIERWRS